MPPSSTTAGASENAQRQLHRALRYHSLQDPQLHSTLKNLLASVSAPGKGLSTAACLYLARREFKLADEEDLSLVLPDNAASFQLHTKPLKL